MEKSIKFSLIIVTLISLYIVLHVGLGWFWAIGASSNYENINQVLINLSYSYIAGYIFYLLVSYIPYKIKIEKLRPTVKLKIDKIYTQINACAQSFQDNDDVPRIIDTLTLEQLTANVNNKGMYENSFYANVAGYRMNNFQFLNATRGNIIDLIDSLLFYKEYLDTNQILNLEKIKDADFLNLIKKYEDSPAAQRNYSHQIFKTALSEDMFEVIKLARTIKNSINEK